MKTTRYRLIIVMLSAAFVAGALARGSSDQESLGDKIKHFFVPPTPTPTPTPHKKRKKTTAVETENTPVPKHTATPSETSSEEKKASDEETPATTNKSTKYFEPVRPITPGPRSRARKQATAVEESAHEAASATPSRETERVVQPISAAEIADYESYPGNVRKILDAALSVSSRDLRYKTGSADPEKGGMDSSGFVYYLFSIDLKDVPRDARAQYVWVRKAGNFRAVLAQTDDTFELDDLKPGDLLFWAGIYGISREPNITQTMIYLGRDKATNQRLMVGASDGGTYKGQSRAGVGVFDFKTGHLRSKSANEPGPVFIGYGSPPGLPQQE